MTQRVDRIERGELARPIDFVKDRHDVLAVHENAPSMVTIRSGPSGSATRCFVGGSRVKAGGGGYAGVLMLGRSGRKRRPPPSSHQGDVTRWRSGCGCSPPCCSR